MLAGIRERRERRDNEQQPALSWVDLYKHLRKIIACLKGDAPPDRLATLRLRLAVFCNQFFPHRRQPVFFDLQHRSRHDGQGIDRPLALEYHPLPGREALQVVLACYHVFQSISPVVEIDIGHVKLAQQLSFIDLSQFDIEEPLSGQAYLALLEAMVKSYGARQAAMNDVNKANSWSEDERGGLNFTRYVVSDQKLGLVMKCWCDLMPFVSPPQEEAAPMPDAAPVPVPVRRPRANRPRVPSGEDLGCCPLSRLWSAT
jgi:hypothetical protein